MLMYYVYAYLRADGTPYYVGKGKDDRAFRNHGKHISVPKDRDRIVFLETNLTELGALALERFYIRWYGRKDNGSGILRNLTDGGEGVSGLVVSEEGRRLRSENNKNRSEEVRRRISTANRGKKRSHETLQRMSEAGRRQERCETTMQKLAEAAERRKKLCTDGIRTYNSVQEMADVIGISNVACSRRLRSVNFPDFQYLEVPPDIF